MVKFRMVSPSAVAIGCPHPPRNFDYSQLRPGGAGRSISTCHRHKLADRGNFKISHSPMSAFYFLLPISSSTVFFYLCLFYLGCQGVNRAVYVHMNLGREALDKRKSNVCYFSNCFIVYSLYIHVWILFKLLKYYNIFFSVFFFATSSKKEN